MLGAPLGKLLGQQLGWRAVFLAIAAFSLVALALVLWTLPPQPAPDQRVRAV